MSETLWVLPTFTPFSFSILSILPPLFPIPQLNPFLLSLCQIALTLKRGGGRRIEQYLPKEEEEGRITPLQIFLPNAATPLNHSPSPSSNSATPAWENWTFLKFHFRDFVWQFEMSPSPFHSTCLLDGEIAMPLSVALLHFCVRPPSRGEEMAKDRTSDPLSLSNIPSHFYALVNFAFFPSAMRQLYCTEVPQNLAENKIKKF